jgi:hypothetical protein
VGPNIGEAKCVVAHPTKTLGGPWPTWPTLQRPPMVTAITETAAAAYRMVSTETETVTETTAKQMNHL